MNKSDIRIIVFAPPVNTVLNDKASRWLFYPVETVSTATILKKLGYEVLGVDLNLYDNPTCDEVKRIICDFQPHFAVVVSQLLVRQEFCSLNGPILKLVKQELPDCITINSGPEATYSPEIEIDAADSDYGLRGEVEDSLPMLIEALLNGDDVRKVPGIYFKQYEDNHQVGRYFSESVAWADMSKFPVPDESLFPRQTYLERCERNNYRYPKNGQPLSFMFTSRGCEFRCSFCAQMRGSYRRKPKDVIFAEIENILASGAKEIHFMEEMVGEVNEIEAFCDEILARQLKFDWFISWGIPLTLLTPENLKKMADAGMYRIALPIESGSQRVLTDLMNKPHTVEHAYKIAKESKRLGIQTIAIFVIGMPGESYAELRQTVEFAKQIDADYSMFSIATPFPGSELEKTVLSLGLTDKSAIREKYPFNSVFFETDQIKSGDLYHLRWMDWVDINFSSSAKIQKMAEMFGMEEAAIIEMAEHAKEKFKAQFPNYTLKETLK